VVFSQSAANVKSTADKFKAVLEPPNGILVGQEKAIKMRPRRSYGDPKTIRNVVGGAAAAVEFQTLVIDFQLLSCSPINFTRH
jgi:hypothetical protein